MRKELLALLRDEEGLTMVEYAVAGALVAAASVTAFTNLGKAIIAQIGNLTAAVNG
jgi:pilus assembly protein Flp/PilA